MTTSALTSGAVAWRRLGVVAGIAGLTAMILTPVALVGTRPEPEITATATEFLTYCQSPNTVAVVRVHTHWLVSFVWFVGALTTLPRRAEGEAAWRSAIALGSGVLFVALGPSSSQTPGSTSARARGSPSPPGVDGRRGLVRPTPRHLPPHRLA